MEIPKRYREGLSKIRKLNGNVVREIRAALDRATPDGVLPPIPAAQAAVRSITPTVPDITQIAEAIGSLYSVKSLRDTSVDVFTGQVCDAMEALDSEEFRLPKEERAAYREKLTVLLGADHFAVSSKAWDLRTDDERVFCNARILTDLRPIFGPHVEEGPRGAVIVHLLKLGFDKPGSKEGHNDFYVSLDSEDLRTLRDLIDRAEAKAKSLTSSLRNLHVFGTGGK